MLQLTINRAQVYLGECFTVEEGEAACAQIAAAVPLAGRTVVIINHPTTAGLQALIDGIEAANATAYPLDRHTEAQGRTDSIEVGEFDSDIIVAHANQAGILAMLKAVGISYKAMESDAAVLDGPASGKTREALSPLAFLLVRAWGALPPPGEPNHEAVLRQIVVGFECAARAGADYIDLLGQLAYKVDGKIW